MKKLMFACTCAAFAAAFADPFNATGFESLNVGQTGISVKGDDGSDSSAHYFCFLGDEGVVDGSMVKAYGGEDSLPAFTYRAACGVPNFFATAGLTQAKYLELSTEGGTLWRTAQDNGNTGSLGEGVDLFLGTTKECVYVDTLVQFTPTEDGTAPTTSGDDKIALWLNVDSTDPDAPVTNLCVKAAVCDEGLTVTPSTFTITNAPEIKPGQWYRLTVKSIADILNVCASSGYSFPGFPGFMIYLDGKLLKSDTQTLTDGCLDLYEAYLSEDEYDNVVDCAVFGSLAGLTTSPKFVAVGFKGSGAIDDLQIGEDVPDFGSGVSSVDFTLTWGEGVSAVFYTIGDGAEAEATKDAKVEDVEPGAVVKLRAVAADWYVIDEATVADLTVDEEGTARTITAALAATPDAAGATGLADVTTENAKAWADANNLTPADIAACAWAKDAYLMNTDLTAQPGLVITDIREIADGWEIDVKGTKGDGDLTLAGIKGALKIVAADTLADLATAEAKGYNFELDAAGVATITVTGDTKKFMKAVVK